MLTQGDVAATTRPKPARKTAFRVISVLVVVVVSVTALFDVARVITISTGRSLYVTGGADGRLPLSMLPQLLQAQLRPGSTGTLADSALSLRLSCAAPYLIAAVTVVLATVFLLGVMRRITAGEPFSPQTLKGWGRLTVTVLGGGILQGLTDTVANVYLASRIGLLFGAGGVSEKDVNSFLGGDYQSIGVAAPHWPITFIICGLVALLLTTAFRAGAKLEKDVEGVV